jgi:hypothetical protein
MPGTATISRGDRGKLKKLALQRGYDLRRTPAGLFWLERGGQMEFGDDAAGWDGLAARAARAEMSLWRAAAERPTAEPLLIY